MVLFTSPREVEVGKVVVGRVGCVVWRWVVKRVTWARARAEERVPMRRVGGGVVVGLVGGELRGVGEGGEELCGLV